MKWFFGGTINRSGVKNNGHIDSVSIPTLQLVAIAAITAFATNAVLGTPYLMCCCDHGIHRVSPHPPFGMKQKVQTVHPYFLAPSFFTLLNCAATVGIYFFFFPKPISSLPTSHISSSSSRRVTPPVHLYRLLPPPPNYDPPDFFLSLDSPSPYDIKKHKKTQPNSGATPKQNRVQRSTPIHVHVHIHLRVCVCSSLPGKNRVCSST